jgi:hypothetical protein
MPGSLEAVDGLLEQLDHGSLGPAEAMEQLLAAQVELHRQRRLASAMSSSRLPALKTLDTFDFSFQPSIDRSQVLSLHQLSLLERKENVIFLGPAGVGLDPPINLHLLARKHSTWRPLRSSTRPTLSSGAVYLWYLSLRSGGYGAPAWFNWTLVYNAPYPLSPPTWANPPYLTGPAPSP